MRFETVYICDHCGARSEPVVTGKDGDGLSPHGHSLQPPPGWASVHLRLDIPTPKSPDELQAEAFAAQSREAAHALIQRMNLPANDPQRVLLEAQVRQLEAVSRPSARAAFSTTMILCSACQVGPAFEVAQREIEAASGVEAWTGWPGDAPEGSS